MKVAWQFTAWNAFTKKTRPVGHGLSWSTDRFAIQVEERSFPPNHTVPYGTDSVSCIPWQSTARLRSLGSFGTKRLPETCPQDRPHIKSGGALISRTSTREERA